MARCSMNTFTDWMSSDAGKETHSVEQLLAFAKENGAEWKNAGNDKDALAVLISKAFPDDAERDRKIRDLQGALEGAWAAWAKEQTKRYPVTETLIRFGEFLANNTAGIIGLALAVVFLIIISPIFGSGTLAQLRDISTARGSITFLFSLGTMIIALLLVTSALFSSERGEKADERRKERFNQGKEVLTILIGILGTIVGFYFGTDKGESNQAQLSVAQAQLTRSDRTIGIATYVKGGEPPYGYTIDFPDEVGITDLTGQPDDNGLILQSVVVPATIEKGKEVTFDVIVRDTTGAEKRTAGKFVMAN